MGSQKTILDALKIPAPETNENLSASAGSVETAFSSKVKILVFDVDDTLARLVGTKGNTSNLKNGLLLLEILSHAQQNGITLAISTNRSRSNPEASVDQLVKLLQQNGISIDKDFIFYRDDWIKFVDQELVKQFKDKQEENDFYLYVRNRKTETKDKNKNLEEQYKKNIHLLSKNYSLGIILRQHNQRYPQQKAEKGNLVFLDDMPGNIIHAQDAGFSAIQVPSGPEKGNQYLFELAGMLHEQCEKRMHEIQGEINNIAESLETYASKALKDLLRGNPDFLAKIVLAINSKKNAQLPVELDNLKQETEILSKEKAEHENVLKLLQEKNEKDTQQTPEKIAGVQASITQIQRKIDILQAEKENYEEVYRNIENAANDDAKISVLTNFCLAVPSFLNEISNSASDQCKTELQRINKTLHLRQDLRDSTRKYDSEYSYIPLSGVQQWRKESTVKMLGIFPTKRSLHTQAIDEKLNAYHQAKDPVSKLQALRDLNTAIKNWQEARVGRSKRKDAVDKLEGKVGDEIAKVLEPRAEQTPFKA